MPISRVFKFPSRTTATTGQEVQDEYRMRPIDEQSVSGFCCYRVTPHEQYQTPPFVYSGPDVIDKFYEHIINETETISGIIRDNLHMLPMNTEDSDKFERATCCGNCDKLFTVENYKVRHRCHVSGHSLFACCNDCNLIYN